MKASHIAFLLALVVTSAYAGQWKVIAPHLATILLGVSFVDANHGYVAGAANGVGPVILYTNNAGQNWTNQNHGIDSFTFLDISMASATRGIASGLGLSKARGAVYTTDGQTWNMTETKTLITEFQDCGHIDTNTFYQVGTWVTIRGQKNGFMISHDGGRRYKGFDWKQLSEPRYGSFLNANTAWLAGGQFPEQNDTAFAKFTEVKHINRYLTIADGIPFFRYHNPSAPAPPPNNTYAAVLAATKDGGNTWTTLYKNVGTATSGFYFNGIQFVDANRGWVVGEGVNATTGNPNAFIWATTDGGKTWKQQLWVEFGSLIMIRMLSATEGWACGATLSRESFTGNYWHTTDGQTWTLESTVRDVYGFNLALVNSNSAYSVAVTRLGVSDVLAYFP